MPSQKYSGSHDGCVLLCYDGSDGSKTAIKYAGETLKTRNAVVLTVWEHFQAWEPYDPLAIGTALTTSFAEHSLGLDQIARDSSNKILQEGIKLAQEAGFNATGRLESGKPWRATVDVAEEIDADPIVVGARGLSRTASLLVGSMTMSVIHHSQRPILVVHQPKNANS